MLVHALRRLLMTVPLLLAASFLVFAIVTSFPGDPCREKLGKATTEAAMAKCRKDLNLDGPFLQRYGQFLAGAVRLDFGHDLRTDEDVGQVVRRRLPPTMELAFVALLLAFLAGTWLGTRSALRPGTWLDVVGQVISSLGVSIPVFWLGMILIAVFGVSLDWLPFSGWSSHDVAPGSTLTTDFLLLESLVRLRLGDVARALQHIALPALALATIPLATITRMTRSAMLEELGRDYVTTARAKGVPERRVIGRHVRRNALIPVVTITGLQLGSLLSGAVLTETVFSWPGLGTYLVKAADQRNYPVLMACMLLFVTIFVVVNLVVDLLYHLIDPRLRAAEAS